MTEQLDLLNPVHRFDGAESREAARKVKADDQYRRVLIALFHAGQPLTDDEIAASCGLLRTSAGTRRGVAVKRGLVRQQGVGVSALGNRAARWVLTDRGRQAAGELRSSAA